MCGTPQSCQKNGCNGRANGAGQATCQSAFKGCSCNPDPNTPGFCSELVQCSFSGCQGTGALGQPFGMCQAPSHKGCACLQSTSSGGGGNNPPPPPPPPPCENDCTAMINMKINSLKDRICTNDDSNNWIDRGTTPDGAVDWWRLDSQNNCFLTLAKSGHERGFPDPVCFAKSDIIDWINRNALGCYSGDAFFRASPPLKAPNQNSGEGEICLSNFNNYQKCGDTTMNGAVPVIGARS